jgi:hypothetical protein
MFESLHPWNMHQWKQNKKFFLQKYPHIVECNITYEVLIFFFFYGTL